MATISVIGHSEVSVAPDEASVELSVHGVGATPADAYTGASARANELVAVLDDLKISAAQRSTSGIWVEEDPEPDAEGRRPGEYQSGQRFTVRTAPDAVGRLLDAAVSRAQAQVSGPRWVVARDNPARNDALRAAGENARVRAEALATGLGVRIGAVAEAAEGASAYPLGGRSYAPLMSGMPVEGDESTIAASVSVTYEVEPD